MPPRKLRRVVPKAQKLAGLWHVHLRNLATDAGVLQEKPTYSRFIILGRSRTGSNLLRNLLNKHSQIITFGELFREYGKIGWDFAYAPRSQSMLSLIETDPTGFVERYVFGNFPPAVGAVGFKLFYYHAHNEFWEPLWPYLANQPGLGVIHVKRQNILKTHLSRKRALLADQWVTRKNGGEQEIAPITVDYEECLQDFIQTRRWEEQYDRLFAQHARIDICYENLARDYEAEIRRVQAFLGVEYQPVSPDTVKQRRLPLSQAILNYQELKDRFAGTPWESFFEE